MDIDAIPQKVDLGEAFPDHLRTVVRRGIVHHIHLEGDAGRIVKDGLRAILAGEKFPLTMFTLLVERTAIAHGFYGIGYG